MPFILFLLGVAVGISWTIWFEGRKKIQGFIDVDHDTDQCIVRMTSEDLRNRKRKKAIFYINHDATISREEQTL